eukprot:m51a1_g13599 hypothetical protein (186) ;mRNA; f:384-1086
MMHKPAPDALVFGDETFCSLACALKKGGLSVAQFCASVCVAPEPECFERIMACFTDDSISEIALGIKDPMTGAVVETPARLKACKHPSFFDLQTFATLMETRFASRWACPICREVAQPSDLVVDGFVQKMLADVGEIPQTHVLVVDRWRNCYWRPREAAAPKRAEASEETPVPAGNSSDYPIEID